MNNPNRGNFQRTSMGTLSPEKQACEPACCHRIHAAVRRENEDERIVRSDGAVRSSVLTITLFLLVLTAGSCRDDDLPSPIIEMTTSTAAAVAGSVPAPSPTSTAVERIADPGGELTAAPNPISVCDGSA